VFSAVSQALCFTSAAGWGVFSLGGRCSATLTKTEKRGKSKLEQLAKVWEDVVRDVSARGGDELADLNVLTSAQFYQSINDVDSTVLDSVFVHDGWSVFF